MSELDIIAIFISGVSVGVAICAIMLAFMNK